MKKLMLAYTWMALLALGGLLGYTGYLLREEAREEALEAERLAFRVRDTVAAIMSSADREKAVSAVRSFFDSLLREEDRVLALLITDEHGPLLVRARSTSFLEGSPEQGTAALVRTHFLQGVHDLRIQEAGIGLSVLTWEVRPEAVASILRRSFLWLAAYAVVHTLVTLLFALIGRHRPTRPAPNREEVRREPSPPDEVGRESLGRTEGKERKPAEGRETERKEGHRDEAGEPAAPVTEVAEEFILARIQHDLDEAAREAEDLTLVLGTISPSAGATLDEEAVERLFGPERTPAKLDEQTFLWVLPATSIQEGLSLVKQAYPRLKEASGADYPMYFGLSSRSGRLLGAEVLLKETRSALKRAVRSRHTPIFGFYADPQRYWEYLSRNQGPSSSLENEAGGAR
ncbi:hypothetical protein [Spirochaeta thermophila]|nr:hypothetical protein [Spirochaeta thermophila]